MDGLHCDETCTPDLADGQSCDEASDCTSANCSNQTCCALGQECCVMPEDCSTAEPAVCDDAVTCQGTRVDASCVEFVCGAQEVDDDSACDLETLALECAPYADVYCLATADQEQPECPTSCAGGDECTDGNACSAGICEPIICTLSGLQGESVDCPLHLVATTAEASPAVQLQLTLDYDDALATVESIVVCGELEEPFNIACTPDGDECDVYLDPTVFCGPETLTCHQCTVSAPEDFDVSLTSGHEVVTCAQPPPKCTEGHFGLMFWGAASEPITTAYLDNGVVTGTSEFVTIRFVLDADVPEGTSVSINPVDFKAPDEKANDLPLEVHHSTDPNPDHFIVTGIP